MKKKYLPKSYLTYVQSAFDKTPRALTRAVMNSMLDSPITRKTLHEYRQLGSDDKKRELPAVLFNGRYVPELAEKHMTTPPKPGEKEHIRRDAQCYVSAPIFALDIDAKGVEMSAQEQFKKTFDAVEQAFGEKPENIIIMAYCTPTEPGWRLVARRHKGLSIQQEQERWNSILPYSCDPVCKNLSRLFFITTRDELLYYNEDMLFNNTDYDPADFPEESQDAEYAHKTAEPAIDNHSENRLQGDYKLRATYPNTPSLNNMDEETLDDLVNELELSVGGGAAMPGNRNNQVYELASLMRYVTGPNIPILVNIVPRYGLSTSEHLRAITSAVNSKILPYVPQTLTRAIERINSKNSKSQSTETPANDTQNRPPQMPQNLPAAIAHLISAVPEKARAATAISSFAAWRIHLKEVEFHYIDNLAYEPCFLCVTVAAQTEGKTATRMPSECILESILAEDKKNREAEERWREQCSLISSSKDKPAAPSLPIRDVQANMTLPALTKRAVNSGGYSLYTYAEEAEKLQKLDGLTEIMRCSYDGARWGQERVSAQAVSAVVERLRWSINVNTTPSTARYIFKGEMANGTFTRISVATIMSDDNDFGEEMPVYGDFGSEYKQGLAPYINNLRSATGIIRCTEAEEWAESERHRQIDLLRSKDQRYMLPFMKRSLQMAFWRACILYIMNGNQWSQEIADFATWSINYDMWVKLHYFGDLIESGIGVTPDNTRYTTSLLPLLPKEFSREQARNMRRDAGRTTSSKDVRNMISQWTFRGFIRYDKQRNLYIKTEP
jgi:hypothetical protein